MIDIDARIKTLDVRMNNLDRDEEVEYERHEQEIKRIREVRRDYILQLTELYDAKQDAES